MDRPGRGGGGLDWNLIAIGGGIGVVVVIVDELLRKGEEGRASAARGRHGHLFADVADLADPDRGVARPLTEKWAAR